MKRAVLTLLAGCGLVACSSDHPSRTEINVTVTSDLKVPEEIDYVTLIVTGLKDDASQRTNADLTKQGLPRRVTLVHQSGDLGPITVVVTGMRNDKKIVESKVKLFFQYHASYDVTIDLQSECKWVFCDNPELTCHDGECNDVPIDHGEDAGTQIVSDGSTGDDGDAGSMVKPIDGSVPTDKPDADVPIDAGPPANRPPVCEVSMPSNGQNFNPGEMIELTGTCTDPDGNVMLPSEDLHWTDITDNADVEDLGTGSSVKLDDPPPGMYTFQLCAADPEDSTIQSECDEIDIVVSEPGPPTATIGDIVQDDHGAPFVEGEEIILEGIGTGINPITYEWSDDLTGEEFGAEATGHIASPIVGRHRITFTVTDPKGDSAAAEAVVDVVPAGQTTLIQPFDDVNQTLGEGADAIAVDSQLQVLAARGASLYRFDASSPGAQIDSAITSTFAPPITSINQIFIATTKVYLATTNGLIVCDYVAGTEIDGSSCETFRDGDLPSNNVTAVMRAKADNVDTLVVGTDDGLFVPDDVDGSTTGVQLTGLSTAGRSIKGIVLGYAFDETHQPSSLVDVFYFAATSGDLGLYFPSDDRVSARGDGNAHDLACTGITVTASERIWVSSSNEAVARWTEPTEAGSNGGWQYWDASTDPRLPTDTTFAIATTRVTLNDADHDVIWIGSTAGLTRLDPASSVESVETLSSDDGLPSNSVIAIAVAPNGDKIISTDSGLAVYKGL